MYLSDCFMQLVAYFTLFLKNVDRQPPFETVQGDIQRLLSLSVRLD